MHNADYFNSADITFASKNLQHEFKHAEDFGIAGNWSNANKALFEQAIKNHIDKVATPISGTYRGSHVFHYLDEATGLNVFVKPTGEFWGAWRLGPAQINYVKTTGALN